MSFLDDLKDLVDTRPSVDPELVDFATNSFSSQPTERPYHMLDDATIGTRVSRDAVFRHSTGGSYDEVVASHLSSNVDGQLEIGSDEEEEEEDTVEELSGDEQEDGYETGDSNLSGKEQDESEEGEEADLRLVSDAPDAGAVVEDTHLKKDAVKFQSTTWEKLVQLRLKLQPVLQGLAALPPPSKRSKYMSGDTVQGYRNTLIKALQGALDSMLDIQDDMVTWNKALRDVMSGKNQADPNDEEIPSDTDEEEDEENAEREEGSANRKRKQNSSYYREYMDDHVGKFKSYNTKTISEWYEQTKIGPSKTSFMNKEVTVLDQIGHILSNRDRLLTRTHQNRSSVRMFGGAAEEDEAEGESCETHPYNFNDDDFYQQILREIIDRKMGKTESMDPDAMGRQWVELQKLKIKSKKKNVDTKASKGRKIRYSLHSKLLGFMAPVPTDTLTDERQDELFKFVFKR